MGSSGFDDYRACDCHLGNCCTEAQHDPKEQSRFDGKHTLSKERVHRLIEDERGSVESHLTIIPLTILFLLTLQLTALASWQVGRVSSIDGVTNMAAISGKESSLSSSATLRHFPLVGGGRIAVVDEEREIPLLANFARVIPGLSLQGVKFRHRTVSLSEYYAN